MKPKILAVCKHGNNRSVHLGVLLKDYYGYPDTLVAGVEKNSHETLIMLFEWADKIVVLEEWMKERIPGEYWDKTLVFDVGADIWGLTMTEELVEKLKPLIEEHLG